MDVSKGEFFFQRLTLQVAFAQLAILLHLKQCNEYLHPKACPIFPYVQSFLVPVVEAEWRAGPGVLPVHDSPFGRLGGKAMFVCIPALT